jgi:hypothetical protein
LSALFFMLTLGAYVRYALFRRNRLLTSCLSGCGWKTPWYPTVQRALQFATAQNNTALANALQRQIALYQAGFPFRDTSQTNVSACSNRP